MTDRKYCEDCRFCKIPLAGASFARCDKAPETSAPERFVSRQYDRPSYAASMRDDVKHCGPDAKWFEPKTAEQVAA